MILAVEWPILEGRSLASAVRLAKRLGHCDLQIGVATSNPAGEWLSRAFEEGANFLAIESPGDLVQEGGLGASSQRLNLHDCCPELHQRIRRNTPLSVCGCHQDRMVIAGHHLARWCLKNHGACPHWKATGVEG
jgi:hypothetical protein